MTDKRKQYQKEYYRKKRAEHPDQFICYWLQYYVKRAKEWQTTDTDKYNTIVAKFREIGQELNIWQK